MGVDLYIIKRTTMKIRYPGIAIFFAILFLFIFICFGFITKTANAVVTGNGGGSSPSNPPQQDETVSSNCVDTAIGNPSQNQSAPPGCGGVSSTKWPFPQKAPYEFNRIDQGWDLEYNKPTEVLAVADGTINLDHGSNPCNGGSGFGDTYPIEVLDKPVTIAGRKYTAIYYGHVNDTKLGHVTAGTPIAQTYHCVMDNGVWLNWLEMGFWGPGGPVGQSIPSTAGYDMEQYLNGTRKGNGNGF